ncbi:conserved hypothetical protein, partial [Ricinus communis]
MPAITSRASDEALDDDTLPAPVATVAGAAETAPIATARAAKARTGAASDATPTATPITAPWSTARALSLLAAGWMLIYAAGLARAVARHWQARHLWRGL